MNRKARGALWGLLGIAAAAIGLMVWHAMQPAPAPSTEASPVIALPDLEGRPRQG